MDIEQLAQRHQDDEEKLMQRIAALETRMTVVEKLGDGWERRLSDLYVRINAVSDDVRAAQIEMRKGMDYVATMLREHIHQEQADREKLLRSALFAMLGGIVSAGGWMLTLVWDHMLVGVAVGP